jgi:hypothetical protein
MKLKIQKLKLEINNISIIVKEKIKKIHNRIMMNKKDLKKVNLAGPNVEMLDKLI